MASPSAFERRQGIAGPTGPTGPAGPSGPSGPTGPGGGAAISLSGNTSGTLTLLSSGTAILAGGNNITLSQSGSRITISGANVGGAQTGISGIANSQTTYTSGTVSLSGAGALTIASTTGQKFQFSVPATSSLSATGAVSLSTNGSTISIGAPVQSAQTGISGIANSQTTYTSGTVSLSELGAVTIRSTTGNQFQISVAAQSVQPETQTFIGGIRNSETTYTSGTVNLSVVGGPLTIRSTTGNAFQFSAAAQSTQVETQTFVGGVAGSNTTYTSGTISLTGVGGGVTVSSNTGQRIDISVAAPVAQTNQAGSVYASSNTFGTSSGTYDARSISIAGRGAVSVAASNSGWVISAPAQSVQAETQTFVGGIANSQTTYTSGTVSLSELGAITIRSTTGNQFQLSVNSQTAQTGISAISNSNTTFTSGTIGLSELGAITIRSTTGNQFQFSVNSQTVQTQSAMNITLSGNSTSGGAGYILISSGTMALAGGPNITLSQDGKTVSISGPAAGAGGGVAVAGSNTTYTSGTALFSGVGGGITVSSNTGQRIDLSVAAPVAQTNQSGNVYASSNTTGTSSGTYDARSISIAGAGAASVAASNSGWIVSAPATSSLLATGQVSISTNVSTISIGVPNPVLSYRWIEGPLLMGATQGIGTSGASNTTVSAWVQPITLPTDLAFNNLNLAVHNSFSSATTSISSVRYSYSMGASVGFYTLTGSSMSLVTSFSHSLGYTNQTAVAVGNMSFTVDIGYGGSHTSKTTQAGANVSAIMSSINSIRQIPLVWSTQSQTLTRGQYWAVIAFSQLTGSVANASLSQVGFVSNYSAIGSALNPPPMFGDTASVTSPFPFLGMATLVNSSNSLMPVSFNTSKITTATAIANSTAFQSIWMNIYSSHGT